MMREVRYVGEFVDRIEVRCCCDPAKLLGTVPCPNPRPRAGERITFLLRARHPYGDPARGDERVECVTLEIQHWSRYFAYACELESGLALKSDDTPLDTLRRIHGGLDARLDA